MPSISASASRIFVRSDLLILAASVAFCFSAGSVTSAHVSAVNERESAASSAASSRELAADEAALSRSFTAETWADVTDPAEKQKATDAAKISKSERTNIRLAEADMEGIKLKAREKGLGYQTLIASLVHRYV